MIPFTIDMPRLFELFLAEWLKGNLPREITLKSQHKVNLDGAGRLSFQIDVVLFDATSRQPIAVLDTKYKTGELPSEQDIQQIIAYAVEMGVSDAFLVFPSTVTAHIDLPIGPIRPIRIRSLVFDLSKDLAVAGQEFLDDLRRVGMAPAH